jgi:hypothetical protein
MTTPFKFLSRVSLSRLAVPAAAAVACATLMACSGVPLNNPGPWRTLIDGTRGLENFDVVGQANWSGTDGAVQATSGTPPASFLVTRERYKDVEVRAEFWSSDDANSGVFIRCQDPKVITDENCYEANIFDQRPDPTYGTGAIVKFAVLTAPMIKAGGKWNTMVFTAKGSRLTVTLNGQRTVEIDNSKLGEGPIALQWGRGTIRFRKVEVRTL